MKKLLSVLYQYFLKGKNTKDIPYISTLNAIFFTIIVNVAALSFGFEVNLVKFTRLNWATRAADIKLVQYTVGIVLIILLYYVIMLLIPKETLQNTNFSSKEYKRMLWSFFTYLILSVLAMKTLIIKYFITHR